MNCQAPDVPEGCSGAVVAHEGVPLCELHLAAWKAAGGPWRTPTGAREWHEAMLSVVQARSVLDVSGVTLEDPSRPGREALPWIDWKSSERPEMKWIGGSPGWDSSDGRFRLVNLLGEKRNVKSGNAKSAKNAGKNRGKFWHWKKFGKKKKG